MATLVRLLLLVLSSFFYLPDFISILGNYQKVCVEDVVSSRPDTLTVFHFLICCRFIIEDPELKETFSPAY